MFEAQTRNQCYIVNKQQNKIAWKQFLVISEILNRLKDDNFLTNSFV